MDLWIIHLYFSQLFGIPDDDDDLEPVDHENGTENIYTYIYCCIVIVVYFNNFVKTNYLKYTHTHIYIYIMLKSRGNL